MKRGGILLSIGGGLFFVLFILLYIFAVHIMAGWEESGLEKGQEEVESFVRDKIPTIMPIFIAMVFVSGLGIIITITGVIVWYRQRKSEKQYEKSTDG